MGDNRDNSTDSRSDQIGEICVRDVVGRAWLRYWPTQHDRDPADSHLPERPVGGRKSPELGSTYALGKPFGSIAYLVDVSVADKIAAIRG